MDETALLWTLGGFAVGIGWLVLTNINHGKKILILETSMANLGDRIETSVVTFESNLLAMNKRMDLYIKTETDMLKSILKENTDALGRLSDR